LKKKHIDRLTGKLQITYLGIIFTILVIFILIIHWLSGYISRPIAQLTRAADEISRGNMDVKLNLGSKDGHIAGQVVGEGTDRTDQSTDLAVHTGSPGAYPIFHKGAEDEVVQLANSFRNMVAGINIYRSRLKESEEKYRSLFDSGPDPVFVLDTETLEILDANPCAEQTYGYSREELAGRSFADLAPEDKAVLALRSASEKNSVRNTFLLSHHTRAYKKGKMPFFVNIHACRTQYRGREALIVATHDITQLVEKDAQLIQASKMSALGEMSAAMVHELNQPLNTIKMGSEFLKMMIDKGEVIRQEHLNEVLTAVGEQVDRASEIINSLREFCRKADSLQEKVDINAAIQKVLALLGPRLSLQNIKVNLDLHEALPPILAHDNRLQQVLFNLITNARDAINSKKEIKDGVRTIDIKTFLENDRVELTISDSGAGIPESLRENIFEPFFTTKEAGQGMGLGLSISYGIIQQFGGRIEFQSREDVGTTFKVSFPVHLSTGDEKRDS